MTSLDKKKSSSRQKGWDFLVFVCFSGFLKVGLRIVFVNYNLRSRSLAHCIHAGEATYLIVGEGNAYLIKHLSVGDKICTWSILN